MPGMQHDMGNMQMGQMAQDDIAKNANDVPNFPQDAYMEGPMMAMDETVERPENYGLRRRMERIHARDDDICSCAAA